MPRWFQKMSSLQLIGIQVLGLKTQSRCFFFCLIIWLITACVFGVIRIAFEIKKGYVNNVTIVSFALSLGSSIFMYLALLFKKRRLASVQDAISNIPIKVTSKSYLFLKIMHILNFIVFFAYPGVVMYNIISESEEAEFSDFSKKTFLDLCLPLFMTFSYIFNQMTLPYLLTLTFSSFCLWCSLTLKRIEKRLKLSIVSLQAEKVISLLNLYQTVLQTTMSVESIFSSSVFLLLITYLVTAFSTMAHVVQGSSPKLLQYHSLFPFSLTMFGMTLLIVYASEIPLVLEKIKLSLIVLEEKFSLKRDGKCSETIKIMIETCVKRSDFSFSACHIIYFKRSMIITCYGALISYGLLLHQMN